MNEIQTIEERLLTYYNDLVKNNVIEGIAPVTLDWLRRQRIVIGRHSLENRFGKSIVDKILGEQTPIAKAEIQLHRISMFGQYELLPDIACLLAKECNEMLEVDNPIRKKYSTFDTVIDIPIFEMSGIKFHFPDLQNVEKRISIEDLKVIIFELSNNMYHKEPLKKLYFEYIQKSVIIVLQSAFEEIRDELETQTK